MSKGRTSVLDRAIAGFAASAVIFAGWAATGRTAAPLAAGLLAFLCLLGLLRRLGRRPPAPVRPPLSALELGPPPTEVGEVGPVSITFSPTDGRSVPELMQRLERALGRLGDVPSTDDERLRSAIEQLQRMAGRR